MKTCKIHNRELRRSIEISDIEALLRADYVQVRSGRIKRSYKPKTDDYIDYVTRERE